MVFLGKGSCSAAPATSSRLHLCWNLEFEAAVFGEKPGKFGVKLQRIF